MDPMEAGACMVRLRGRILFVAVLDPLLDLVVLVMIVVLDASQPGGTVHC